MFYLMLFVTFMTMCWTVAYMIGLALPKGHTATRTAVFRAKPEAMFALIAGPQDWRTAYEPVETGAGMQRRWKETSRHGAILFEEVRSDAPRLYEMRIANEDLPFGGSWMFELTPAGTGTRVQVTEAGQVKPPVFRFISQFMLGHTRTIEGYLNGLAEKLGEEISIEP